MVLIVQMVKLAAPTKQQTIYSNKYTHTNTHQPPAGFADTD